MSRFNPASFRATSKYGMTPIHPHQARKMAVYHRKVGTLAYRRVRLTMDNAHNRAELYRLVRDLNALRARGADRSDEERGTAE